MLPPLNNIVLFNFCTMIFFFRQLLWHTLSFACVTNTICKLRMPQFFFCLLRFTRYVITLVWYTTHRSNYFILFALFLGNLLFNQNILMGYNLLWGDIPSPIHLTKWQLCIKQLWLRVKQASTRCEGNEGEELKENKNRKNDMNV
jgi:hypothetical protein